VSYLTLQQLRNAVRALDGSVLTTLHRHERFVVRLAPRADGMEYTPLSTASSRLQRWRSVEEVLDLYNASGSLHPGDYRDITNHASYTLAIIQRILAVVTADDLVARADLR
jgi:hypothetical protein